MPLPASSFPLRTSGSRILGADGSPVLLAGVNWGGGQQDEGVPWGLDRMHRDEIAARVAALGLNHVRLPFAVGSILTTKGNPVTTPVPDNRVAANPDLTGRASWDVLQAVTESCLAAGLYVILNQHLLYPGWCCSAADNNGFWYNDSWPASAFIRCWEQVAARFAASPAVGYDIHNEPRPAVIGGAVRTPSWGTGSNTDFRQMYETMTTLIRRQHPGALMFCEGLSYASDLTGWRTAPVRAPGVVASVHDYAWFHSGVTSYAAYEAAMDARAGYLVTQGLAPLWAGEFGSSTDAPLAVMCAGWLSWFIRYAAARGLHWCWWELSATAVKGTQPATNKLQAQAGAREPFGLLAGQDGRGTQADLLAMLAPVMPGAG